MGGIAESLEGNYLAAHNGLHRDDVGVSGDTVHQYGVGPALAGAAAELRTAQLRVVA